MEECMLMEQRTRDECDFQTVDELLDRDVSHNLLICVRIDQRLTMLGEF